MTAQDTASPAVKQPQAPDIQFGIRVPEGGLRNPTVESRHCLSAAMHRRITEGLAKGYGYAILQVARMVNDHNGSFEIRELRDPLCDFQFLTFTKPGKWEVALFLFERTAIVDGKDTTLLLERRMAHRFLDEYKRARRAYSGKYVRSLDSFSSIGVSAGGAHPGATLLVDDCDSCEGVTIAKCVTTISVPKDIFAKPRSPFVWGFGNYFYRYPPCDECEFRTRLWFRMLLSFGFIPLGGLLIWLLLELGKRLFCLVVGLGALLLLALKGSPRIIRSAFSLEPKLSLGAAFDELEFEPMGWWNEREWHSLLLPGVLIVGGGIAFCTVSLAIGICTRLLVHWEITLFALAGIGIALFSFFGVPATSRAFVRYLSKQEARRAATVSPMKVDPEQEGFFARLDRLHREYRHNRTIRAGQAKADFAEHFANEIVCSDTPKEITLTAMPAEMVSLWTKTGRTAWFRKIKRDYAHCRPF